MLLVTLLIFITQYFVNLNITKDGGSQYSSAIKSTFVPWLLIFGTTVALFNIMDKSIF